MEEGLRRATVVSLSGRPLSTLGPKTPGTPMRENCRPVIRAAREPEHTGQPEYQEESTLPLYACAQPPQQRAAHRAAPPPRCGASGRTGDRVERATRQLVNVRGGGGGVAVEAQIAVAQVYAGWRRDGCLEHQLRSREWRACVPCGVRVEGVARGRNTLNPHRPRTA